VEYTVEHETVYRYPRSVTESYTVVHLQPRTNLRQYCTGYALDVTPHSRVFSYVDRFGNDVQHFAIVPEHTELRIVARSHVVTLPAGAVTAPQDVDAAPTSCGSPARLRRRRTIWQAISSPRAASSTTTFATVRA